MLARERITTKRVTQEEAREEQVLEQSVSVEYDERKYLKRILFFWQCARKIW